LTGGSEELLGIARFTFHEGQAEEFKRLSAHALEVVRAKDPGTLQYDTYLSDDESAAVVVERYRDSDSLIQHAQNLGDDFMAAIMATGTVAGELLGDMSPELAALMTGDQPRHFTLYQSL
jgi:quinol monooxygenase YgiN